jgi:hypothetical protein
LVAFALVEENDCVVPCVANPALVGKRDFPSMRIFVVEFWMSGKPVENEWFLSLIDPGKVLLFDLVTCVDHHLVVD